MGEEGGVGLLPAHPGPEPELTAGRGGEVLAAPGPRHGAAGHHREGADADGGFGHQSGLLRVGDDPSSCPVREVHRGVVGLESFLDNTHSQVFGVREDWEGGREKIPSRM